jgi:hypothetical protein
MAEARPGWGANDHQLAVGSQVRIYPGTDGERRGRIIEDFGDTAGLGVQLGDQLLADAARRWAVQLADGGLVFVDDGDLEAT